jgi:cell division protein FtsL
MKVSNLLPLIALVLVTATASSIVDTINSLDHATASNADRILKSEKKDLKSEKKDLKSEKKKKDEKKVPKKATKKTKSNQ